MNSLTFTDGRDEATFAPFVLIDRRDTEFNDIRLQFNAWDLLHATIGGDHIGDYYFYGPGVQGLVVASRIAAGLDPMPAGVMPNSEADTCYMHFGDLDTAIETATMAQNMISDRAKIEQLAGIATDEGFDDM